MFSSLPNLVILLIPLAIFIGRMVVEARKKREGQPKIPVHFEDGEEEAPLKNKAPVSLNDDNHEFYPHTISRETLDHNKGSVAPGMAAQSATMAAASSRRSLSNMASTGLAPSSDISFRPVSEAGSVTSVSRGTGTPAGRLPPTISRLPPLKQAVVMAEILGTPKGLM